MPTQLLNKHLGLFLNVVLLHLDRLGVISSCKQRLHKRIYSVK